MRGSSQLWRSWLNWEPGWMSTSMKRPRTKQQPKSWAIWSTQEQHGRILEPPSSCKLVLRSSDSEPMNCCPSLFKSIWLRMKAFRAQKKKMLEGNRTCYSSATPLGWNSSSGACTTAHLFYDNPSLRDWFLLTLFIPFADSVNLFFSFWVLSILKIFN